MKRKIAGFESRCLICQKIKAEHRKPIGLLKPLKRPKWKLKYITMDFVSRLPETRKYSNAIWVIVDRLTKSTHFVPFRMGTKMHVMTDMFIKEVVRLPASIVSDRAS